MVGGKEEIMEIKKCNGKACIVDNKSMCARYDTKGDGCLKKPEHVICVHFIVMKSQVKRK